MTRAIFSRRFSANPMRILAGGRAGRQAAWLAGRQNWSTSVTFPSGELTSMARIKSRSGLILPTLQDSGAQAVDRTIVCVCRCSNLAAILPKPPSASTQLSIGLAHLRLQACSPLIAESFSTSQPSQASRLGESKTNSLILYLVRSLARSPKTGLPLLSPRHSDTIHIQSLHSSARAGAQIRHRRRNETPWPIGGPRNATRRREIERKRKTSGKRGRKRARAPRETNVYLECY